VYPAGTYHVYVIDTDDHVHEFYWNGTEWTNGDVSASAGLPDPS
jgi:hypothetical protein